MKKDTIIGIVGTIILVLGMVGVFRFEGARGGGSSFDVAWDDSTIDGPGLEGTARAGADITERLMIDARNVTRASFTLTWTDDVGDPDEFNITITSPMGASRSAQGSSGSITVAFEGLDAPPGDFRTLAESADEARERIARDETNTVAVGEWVVEVRLVRAPGLVAPAGGVELQPDGANAWTLETRLDVYEAIVTPA